MSFQIVRNDITRVRADAIVNTANPRPIIGGGVDTAIYMAAGEKELLAERIKIGELAPGQAAHTPAFHLPARFIIHTVGPSWVDGAHGERETLASCYANSLALAADLSCESIAFPMIATGVYGFPKDEALQIALSEIGRFLLTHEMTVTLVVFDRGALELSRQVVSGIEEYIDDHSARRIREAEFRKTRVESQRIYEEERRLAADQYYREAETVRRRSVRKLRDDASEPAPSMAVYGAFPDAGEKTLDEVLANKEETFQQRLLKLIDESGMDDVTVYKKANIDRKVFSRIRCKEDYRPKKKTAVAFAIALQLDLPTMTDLLSRAEIAISPSNTFDLIVSYFVTQRNYDIYEINAALFKYGQPILGE